MNEQERAKSISYDSGLLKNYFIHIGTLRQDFIHGRKKEIIQRLQDDPLKTYTEFSPEQVNDANRANVEKIDKLIRAINALGQEQFFDTAKFVQLYNEIMALVDGNHADKLEVTDFAKFTN